MTIGITIRKVATDGTITTVAGTGLPGFRGDKGPATSARLYTPTDVAVDETGNLFIADSENDCIRKVSPTGISTTVAGYNYSSYSGDNGPATSAGLAYPTGIAIDQTGNLFIADWGNNRIRKVSTNGIITTVAGNGTRSFGGDNGPAISASLNLPYDVAVDGLDNLFIADSQNHRICKVAPDGTITTVAGSGTAGFGGDNGLATSASLYYPESVAVDAAGNLFIADSENYRVRKVDPNGIITTVAGNSVEGSSGDNGLAINASLSSPSSIAVDRMGNLFIDDNFNYRVRKVGDLSSG